MYSNCFSFQAEEEHSLKCPALVVWHFQVVSRHDVPETILLVLLDCIKSQQRFILERKFCIKNNILKN